MIIEHLKNDFIIFDFSTLFFPINNELIEELKDKDCVYESSIFDCECNQVCSVVSKDIKEIYDINKNLIQDISFYQFPDEIISELKTKDSFGMVSYLAEQENVPLLITHNKTLIDKIIFSNIKCCILDTSDYDLIKPSQFKSYMQNNSIDGHTISMPYYEVNENSKVFNSKGEEITLSKQKDNPGREAYIYKVKNKKNSYAKIFNEENLTVNKVEHIKKLYKLNKILNIDWVSFPIELLYYNEELTKPIGYVMKTYENMATIGETELFSGRLLDILPDYRDETLKTPLSISLVIAKQVLWLNINGVIVSDFNDDNFFINRNSLDKQVKFIDSDSFCYNNYYSKCCAQNNTTRKYNISEKLDLILFAEESMIIFIFKLLTLGIQPLYRGKFRYRNDRPVKIYDYAWEMIPSSLKCIFKNTFENNKISSINELIHNISSIIEKIDKSQLPNRTYRDLLSNNLYISRADSVGDKVYCVLNKIDNSYIPQVLVNNNNNMILKKQKYSANEILTFSRNNDGSYYITAFDNISERFLFLTAIEEKKQVMFREHDINNPLSQQWRIEIAENSVLNSYSELQCIIGNEFLPLMLLTINSNNGEAVLKEKCESLDQHLMLRIIDKDEYTIKPLFGKSRRESSDETDEARNFVKRIASIFIAFVLILFFIIIFVLLNSSSDRKDENSTRKSYDNWKTYTEQSQNILLSEEIFIDEMFNVNE